MSSQVMWRQPWSEAAEANLRQALRSQGWSIRELPTQQWNPSTSTIGDIRGYMTSYLAPASAGWSSIMLHLNSLLAEPLAAEVSRLAGVPAIAFFEYDQTTWGYYLFESGNLLDKFWSIPQSVEEPPEQCAGSVATVSRVFGVPAELVAPYLRHLTEDQYDCKAFHDDEFTLSDHWVRVDFMRRLGLITQILDKHGAAGMFKSLRHNPHVRLGH